MKKYIEENFEELLNDLSALVSFNSVNSNDGGPFGIENQKVLDKAIEIMNDKGLKTNNVDYYCAYGEVGAGDELIGILAHLDVVPAGDSWTSDPFKMVERDGFLYGRGVSDDKGPAVAVLYAIKYLIDTGYKFKKRVRLILGCNEETGSECIRYYVSKYGHVDMGFTPDAEFPGIIGEKGMLGGQIHIANSKVISIKGGEANNIVCKEVKAELPKNSFDLNLFKEYLDNHDVKYEINEAENLEIKVFGVAAHASLPDLGVNAISHLLEALYASNFNDSLTDFFHKYFKLEVHGEGIGFLDLKDEFSDTSINFGIIDKNDDVVTLNFDMRFPVKSNVETVKNLFEKITGEDISIPVIHGVEPLFFDPSSKMIKALKKAYEDVSGDRTSEMMVIGGGTYAKSINNCIAFGGEFLDSGYNPNMHGADEKIKIADLKRQIEIYIEAIKNLNEA